MRQPKHPRPRAITRGANAKYHHARLPTRIVLDGLHDLPGGGERTDDWPSILAELHARLLEPAGCDHLAKPSAYVQNVLRTIEESEGFGDVRQWTVGNPQAALRATCDIAAGIEDRKPNKSDGSHVEQTAEELGQIAQQAKDFAKEMLEQEKPELAEKAMKLHDEARAEQFAAAQQQSATLNKLKNKLHRASTMRQVADGAESVNRAATVAAGLLAGNSCGVDSARDISYEMANALADNVDALEALKRAGAWLAAAKGKQSSRLPGREGMLGPTTGGLSEIGDLLPMELLAIGGHLGQAAKSMAMLRLVENKAAVAEKGGGHGQLGDVAICLDCSSSMLSSGRTEAAHSITFALCIDRIQRGRKAKVIPFDGRMRKARVLSTMTELLDAAKEMNWEPSGGTAGVTQALSCAGHWAKQHGEDPEVVAVTDGHWPSWDRPDVKRMVVALLDTSWSQKHLGQLKDSDQVLNVHRGDEGQSIDVIKAGLL